jgi:Transglycosylase SLT domain/D-alanyl-D-alanine carboxypeptidase
MTAAILVSGTAHRASLAMAASIAVEGAILTGAGTLLIEAGAGAQRRGPTLLASRGARLAEESLRREGVSASARGQLCHLVATEGDVELGAAVAAAASGEVELAVVHLPGRLWVPTLDAGLPVAGGCLLVSLPSERSLAALAVGEMERRQLPLRIATRAPGALAARRALAGARPGDALSDCASRIAKRLLGLGRRPPRGARLSASPGQALPALLGAAVILILAALALAAIGGAATGRGRVQRAADLAALSAVRSMRDDLPRLLGPRRLPDGAPNPRHLTRGQYLGRAHLAGVEAARRNDVDPARLRIAFPDAAANPPLRAKATITGEVDPARLPGGDRLPSRALIRVVASAVAEASAPLGSWSGMPQMGEGGGYSGPLVYRDGEGMRPDVAAAYDRMSAAARRSGLDLLVVSGFRSDAEQAQLFARHPDPRWVAPPGHSLHRCATELDLGPSAAYGWLLAHARGFGFLKRYPWEPWHFGFVGGPPPCSEAGNLVDPDGEDAGQASATALPGFVPAPYRVSLLHSASRWNVSPGLLAAQLMAESGFNPRAVSPAGALGIAQFMPATARSYGLRDPFDPTASIDAQAHLMSDLLRQFHSVPLALAAYNAGAGAVAACRCVPPYPETRAYIARILALADGAGVLLAPPLEVQLIE